MDREEKISERYSASAEAGAPIPNNAEFLRQLLTTLYVSGAGDGMMRWHEDDRDFFLTCLLDAAEGRSFVPFPLPWPSRLADTVLMEADIAKTLVNDLASVHAVLIAHGKMGIAKKIYDAAFMIEPTTAIDKLDHPNVV